MNVFHIFTILLYDIIGFIITERKRERERERERGSRSPSFARFTEMVIFIFTGMGMTTMSWFTLLFDIM